MHLVISDTVPKLFLSFIDEGLFSIFSLTVSIVLLKQWRVDGRDGIVLNDDTKCHDRLTVSDTNVMMADIVMTLIVINSHAPPFAWYNWH